MSEFRVAQRYAKSIIDLATEKNELDAVNSDMTMVKETIENSRDLRIALTNPIISNEKKLDVLKALFGGKVSEGTQKFFQVISNKGRESYLYSIAGEAVRMYNEIKGIEAANVTTAIPLTSELRQEFITLVENITKKSVNLSEKVDENILGGFVLTINDRQIDASVSSKLQNLRLEFANS